MHGSPECLEYFIENKGNNIYNLLGNLSLHNTCLIVKSDDKTIVIGQELDGCWIVVNLFCAWHNAGNQDSEHMFMKYI